jgi:hypothetical protein
MSVVGTSHFMNKMPWDLFFSSKKQDAGDSTTCGSKFDAFRTAAEQQIIDLCATLCCLGVPVKHSTMITDIKPTMVDTSSTVFPYQQVALCCASILSPSLESHCS